MVKTRGHTKRRAVTQTQDPLRIAKTAVKRFAKYIIDGECRSNNAHVTLASMKTLYVHCLKRRQGRLFELFSKGGISDFDGALLAEERMLLAVDPDALLRWRTRRNPPRIASVLGQPWQ